VTFAWRRPLTFTVPKSADQRNEDSFQWSSKGVLALSDGASISFDSATWSRILVRQFARCPEINKEWLSVAIREFSAIHDRENLPWAKQASFDRGSFASMLGVRCFGSRMQIVAIGDSLAVLGEGDRVQSTFPYTRSSEFDKSPQLLCTNPVENAFLDDLNGSDELYADWTMSCLDSPWLMCMTDALGQWLLASLEQGLSPVGALREIKTPRAFTHFVEEERASGRMKRDDTTLMISR